MSATTGFETLPVYREHPVAPQLRPLVDCLWTRRGVCPPGSWERNRVLPDGRIDIIFNLGDPQPREGGPTHGYEAYLVGAMRSAAAFRLWGRVDLLGVRFAPGGAAALLGLAARELTDRVLELDDAWPGSRRLLDRLRETESTAVRLSILERTLTAAARRAAPLHRAVAAAARMIERSGGAASLSRIQGSLGVSPRHLRRVFGDWVGITPKLASRIARFQRAAAALRSNSGAGWARLAQDCGYHDQAHLIREFHDLAGLAPGAYLRERAEGRFVQYAPLPTAAD